MRFFFQSASNCVQLKLASIKIIVAHESNALHLYTECASILLYKVCKRSQYQYIVYTGCPSILLCRLSQYIVIQGVLVYCFTGCPSILLYRVFQYIVIQGVPVYCYTGCPSTLLHRVSNSCLYVPVIPCDALRSRRR